MQNTLRTSVRFTGQGLHSGEAVELTIHPASADYGIWFKRTDILLGDRMVPARWDVVEQTALCTRIVNAAGVSVSTIEHIMAALAGTGVHNALIEVDGPEVPILDGSAADFVRGILKAGLIKQHRPVRAIEILKPVTVTRGDASATLTPADHMQIDFHIDFEDRAIGVQDKSLVMANGSFVRELCDSRTFCRQADVDAMHAQGLALGGNLENAVVVDGDKVLSPGGLRHKDEAVRHKMLDALGDLFLAGAPILGKYTGCRAGHSLTNELLRQLFATPGAFRVVECDSETAAILPGAGVHWAEIPAVA
ncbi:UDP-3-O-acyl-N-acetylglucosamine deacetylase [Shimia thalassica]|uniref:UDP-3-O-acyl-N-acetylglucosamine deacetylase n=1 Tax=Shimia thalassica TaxID=1715693 RepID=A0A0P1I4R8_9RHOB|nr:UDP-3-O-acyl-N-acetylglucosamine deacetylase [Shimia thalassica]PHO03308.1 UDP-3-O-acyl-N-acetylglucosamine deacetylase [Rhodobacteraceae bacterium 4F10]MBU2944484.1 UDP-3-O-acyl-N-acetylglucosamine deacetylase [Shimia thalassica]MDO6479534.1 UDP-3-O-acyl-N-acetylglucosamine deacetylase [Shimia thalassica]MDO6482548.1 UDP-3-O-acyl-N-acetylglucosamine deacetylase [Shimia thalassica]MDO6502170.1 UDP-3-O-acyl-N-acetylglucosamine deacetylase [Shimia thalassica]